MFPKVSQNFKHNWLGLLFCNIPWFCCQRKQFLLMRNPDSMLKTEYSCIIQTSVSEKNSKFVLSCFIKCKTCHYFINSPGKIKRGKMVSDKWFKFIRKFHSVFSIPHFPCRGSRDSHVCKSIIIDHRIVSSGVFLLDYSIYTPFCVGL